LFRYLAADAPQVHIVGGNTTVATGTDAELKCLVVVDEAYDRSNISVNWYRQELSIRVGNTSRVTVTESRRQGSIDKRLMIRSVSRRDVGKYICKAEYDGQGSGIRSSRDTWLRIQEAPIVRVTSRRINYQRGDSIRVTCSATGVPRPAVTWLKGNAEVLSDMHISARNNVLQILDAKEEHKGVYNCKAENSGGVSAEPVSIVYVERPTVKAVNNSVVGIVGERRQLRCNATGQPVPTVTWRRNGVPIVAGPEFAIDTAAGTVSFVVDARARGEWTCLAENVAGLAEDRITMDIGTYPTASVPSTAISIEYGQSGNLPCQASGGHSPNIEWLRVTETGSQLLIRDSEKYSFNVVSPTSKSLVINAAKDDDAGWYICRVTNPYGDAQERVRVKIIGHRPPVLANVSPRRVVKIGASVSLKCTYIDGKPEPKISWFVELSGNKTVRLIEASDSKYLVESLDGGKSSQLLIRDATFEDEATYNCRAVNSINQTEQSIELDVQSEPKFNRTRTNYQVNEGEPVTLYCISSGDPRPIVRWSLNRVPLNFLDSDYSLSDDGMVLNIRLVRNSKHSGTYSCEAVNDLGTDAMQLKLDVQTPPRLKQAYEKVKYVIKGRSLDLTCKFNGNPTPTVSWYFRPLRVGQAVMEIRRSQGRFILSEGATRLHVTPTVEADEGFFECIGLNSVGRQLHSYRVNVLVPPKSTNGTGTDSPLKITAKIGEPLRIGCNVTGKPKPEIQWYFKGQRLSDADAARLGVRVSRESELLIDSIESTHVGLFQCRAFNKGGNVTLNFDLTAIKRPVLEPNLIGSKTVIQGDSMNLLCTVKEGFPRPQIFWWFRGAPATDSELERLGASKYADGSLYIRDVRKFQHDGPWKCQARNEGGVSGFHVTTVIVFDPREASASGADKPDRTGDRGSRVTFTCETEMAWPQPRIQWLRNGQSVETVLRPEDYTLTSDKTSLILLSVNSEDSGIYTCLIGEDGRAKNFTLTVQYKPEVDRNRSSKSQVIAEKGKTLVLVCSVSGYPDPEITWYKGGAKVTRGAVSNRGQKLEIISAKLTDAGDYQCFAQNLKGIASHSIGVTVKQWKYNGRPLPPDSAAFPTDEGASLIIPEVRLANTGIYTCSASNDLGTNSRDIRVVVVPKPKIQPPTGLGDSNRKIVRINSSMVLDCRVSEGVAAGGGLEVTWLKDNVPVNPDVFDNVEIITNADG
uniref:Hemicentin-1 n=1 Tax=Macrostomum lignano TaxID=282301 RepID=A0A1I8H5N3_9PLAT